MLKKSKKLNMWLWKWHFIAGLIALPFVVVLAITGGIYLFKDSYEAPKQTGIRFVEKQGDAISFQDQWEIAKSVSGKAPGMMVVPTQDNQATEFVFGKFEGKHSVFINPYTKAVTGTIIPKDSDMFAVRKLHGELLLGTFGTKIVELIACWLIVLIITGIYVFWPAKKEGIKGFFKIRFNKGKRVLYRDLHTVFGFWISVLLLLTLAGGLPWTDVFGGYFKWMQKVTNTGYPKTWSDKFVKSKTGGEAIRLDDFVAKARAMKLKGDLNIGLPKNDKGVFSVFNTTFDLEAQKRFHYDQYSGKELVHHTWSDVGVLMRGRMWLMAFHQGQFGYWNWLLMVGVAVLLTFVVIAALISYIVRKPKGKWGTPKVPEHFKVGYGVMAIIVVLAIIFPLFAASVFIIVLYHLVFKMKLK